MHRLAQTFVFLLGVLAAARAQAATIVIIRPTSASPEMTETVSRLHGELLSLGIDVAFAERAAVTATGPSDARARLEPIATARDADAVIEVAAEPAPAAVDIYVLDRRAHRSEVSRVSAESSAENAPARLAIRTIEVLRASLVEIDLAARSRAGSSDVQVVATAPPPQTSAPSSAVGRIGVEAGAAVLTSVDGVGPAVLPAVRIGWAMPSGLVVHATLAGLGTHPVLTAPAGTARVAQQFAVLGISSGAPSARRIRPYAGIAAGVLRTAIDGEADPPAEAHSVNRWSALLDGSVGARASGPSQTFLTLAAHVQVATPYVAVHIADTVAATTGRLNLLLTLTVGAWL